MMEQNRTMNMGMNQNMNQNMNRNMNQGMNQTCQQLWQTINEAGFAMDDINLYLDTHPCDQEALNYYHYVTGLYREAMEAYEAQCGPLRVDQVQSQNYWNWVDDKWPWEGGTR